jgi:hypothetical protein
VSPTTAGIVNGQVDLSAWSDEELIRGQRRSKRGKWEGKPPQLVPKAIHDELVRRKMVKAYDLLKKSTYAAVKTLIEVATDRKADPAVRVKAAETILDRTLGRPTESMKLDVSGLEPWAKLIQASTVNVVATEEPIEGEVVEER